ncbi:hypothetical protein OROMI_008767 [Orobanche minor]
MSNRHTIILMQASHNRATRTFMDYDSISQAMDGICGLYERKLKALNPATRNITYDITDLYNFIDGLPDMSALLRSLDSGLLTIRSRMDQAEDITALEETGSLIYTQCRLVY